MRLLLEISWSYIHGLSTINQLGLLVIPLVKHTTKSMKLYRIVELEELFPGQVLDLNDYLRGISRRTLLDVAANHLGYLSFVPSDKRTFHDDLRRFFSFRNEALAERLYHQLYATEKRENSHLMLLHQKAALQFFEHVWERADEPETLSEEEIEANLLKANLLLNEPYINQQSAATSGASKALGISQLAAWTLAGTFSDFELVNHSTPQLLMIQIIKSVRLCQFLESDERYSHLLQAFLLHYTSTSWQDYLNSLLAAVKMVSQATAPNRIILIVPPGPGFEESCAFLMKHALEPSAALIKADFTSLRSTPFYQESPGTFVMIHPIMAIEMLHKGLYFRLKLINDKLPKGQRIGDWRSVYCDYFSEQFLLYPVLDNVFAGRGRWHHGANIKAAEYFKKDGDGEPDYYFREEHRAVLFESKDALVNKDTKAGHDFEAYVKHLKRSFFYDDHDGKGNSEAKAAIQLRRNVLRLLNMEFPFDKAYDAEKLVIYPVLVVHDRLYNQPGLNVLVNEWFNQALAEVAATAPSFQHVRPLVIIDVDTLIAFQEHFRDQRLVFEDTLDEYYRYVSPDMTSVGSEAEAQELVTQSVHPYALFLENYARERGLHPIPADTMKDMVGVLGKGV